MSKKKNSILLLLIFLTTIFTIYIYESYFHSYEGRNSQQHIKASNMEHLVNSALLSINNEKINNDMIISSSKKIEVNNNLEKDFYNVLEEYANNNDIKIKNGVYYVEIRNKKVYKVIYANWKYSGYVGVYPDYNNGCMIYQKEVDKSLEEFTGYLKEKE